MTAAARSPSQLRLLTELAPGAAIPGSRLALRLGISRAAVWKQIEQLRGHGLAVTARRGGGYRLESPVDLLDAAEVARAAGPMASARLGGLDVHWQIDSTSSELLRRAGPDARDLVACLAEIQTRGRGRRGRNWQMPLAGGVALSLLKRFEGGMASLAGLSLAVGIAAVQALADCAIRGVGLKWPNDLVARGRKLGGVLVEVGGDVLGPCHAVIGIGINVRLAGAATAAIDQPWIDLDLLADGAAPPRNLVAGRLLARLVEVLDRFAVTGFSGFADAYAIHDALQGRRVRVMRAEGAQEGLARGVDSRGALRVMFADGERAIDSGEVSIRDRA